MANKKQKNKVVDRRFAKDKKYDSVLGEIETKGKCPFCPDNFKYHKHPILERSGTWFITKISWPYENSRHHFIIIKKRHAENISELADDDMKDILFLTNWAIFKFRIKGGAIAMRFGKTDYTGATVCHIHAHLIVPKKGKTVNFPIG